MYNFPVQNLGPGKCLIYGTYYYKNNMTIKWGANLFQWRCPCANLFPPLHGFPILSPRIQKLFGDYFCPRIGIWEENIIKPIRLQKLLFAKMAWSQACWQSECMNQGEMKGTIPFRKCHCQDQSLAWSQSSPPPWLDELDWTSGLCCPRNPCRGQA